MIYAIKSRTSKKYLYGLSLFMIFIISGQALQALDIQLQSELTVKDLSFGIRLEYSEYTASSVNLGPSLNPNAEGFPLGGVVRVRQSFFYPELPFEIIVAGEVEIFNSDGGLVFLPSVGGDIGFRFELFKQDLLFTAGYRYGFTDYIESYEGSQIVVSRITRIDAIPILIGLTWFF